MEVVVGSENIPKREAVANAFRLTYPDASFDIQGVAADSEVSDHPTIQEESLKGALNRAKNARVQQPDADFYVGIEGGLLRVGEQAWEHSWVVVEDRDGQLGTGVSAGLELRGSLLEAILGGQELGKALNERFGIRNAGKKTGIYGLATDDKITREGATVQAVIFALAPFKHPEYFQ